MEASIVFRESTIKTRRKAILGIQFNRSHKRSRAIALSTQDIGNHGHGCRQRPSELGSLVRLRVGSRQNRGVRNDGERRLRVGLLKHQALTRHGVEAWRSLARGS